MQACMWTYFRSTARATSLKDRITLDSSVGADHFWGIWTARDDNVVKISELN